MKRFVRYLLIALGALAAIAGWAVAVLTIGILTVFAWWGYSGVPFGFVYELVFPKMPPESKAQLDARVDEYRRDVDAANAVSDCPNLINFAKDLYAAPPSDVGERVLARCPRPSMAAVRARAAELRRLAGFADRLAPIIAAGELTCPFRGMVTHVDNRAVSATLRYFARDMRDLAALDAEAGRTDNAASVLAALFQLVGATDRSPVILTNMIAISIDTWALEGVIFVLPKLSGANIALLRQTIQSMPDIRATFLRSQKAHFLNFLECVDSGRPGDEASGNAKLQDSNGICPEGSKSFADFFRSPGIGFFKHQRYWMIRFATDNLAPMQQWLDNGAVGAPPQEEIEEKAIMKHIAVLAALVPNWTALMDRCGDDMRYRATVLRAMDLELERRRTGSVRDIVLRRLEDGGEQEIYINQEFGCICADAESNPQ